MTLAADPVPTTRATSAAASSAQDAGGDVLASAAVRVVVTGAVQGVGFRPFVYGLARRLGVAGTVTNTAWGVAIVAEADAGALRAFIAALRSEAPTLARIESVTDETIAPTGRRGFEISPSADPGADSLPVPADAGTCAACVRELHDPWSRRYRHPFVNCTHCGPRFTIVDDLPYDRPRTTMAAFPMCARCAAEYADPTDRRFHAQPIACPDCGPRVRLDDADGHSIAVGDAAIVRTRALLATGGIVAVKGIGGVHLACDASDERAVAELRRRKHRGEKPFAVLVRDVAGARRIAAVSAAEADLLESAARPIVLLRRRGAADGPSVAPSVAPGRDTIGVMLPSAPIHELLVAPATADAAGPSPQVLVLTSGNLADDPIAIDDDDAIHRLRRVADAFLLHDRAIRTRADDSVVRVHAGRVLPIRRSRGYAPLPVALPFDVPPLLAVGAELKSTFCLARGRRAYVGPHVGDLTNWETLEAFDHAATRCERLFRVDPVALARDLHPDFLSTRWAEERAARDGLRTIAVQHHHAHAAAAIVENGLDTARPVIAVVFDGAGLGTDGAVWGGEFLVATIRGFERCAHIGYVPLPGGDAAVRHPWRVALAWLHAAGVAWTMDLAPVRAATENGLAAVGAQVRGAGVAPPTSSAGRLFDAVASIAGVRQHVACEGQAAIELEVAAAGCPDAFASAYPVPARAGATIDVRPLVAAIAEDASRGASAGRVAAQFHESIARMVRDVCCELRAERGLGDVVLTGGVFQNVLLLGRTTRLLVDREFAVHTHHVVPPNDGGISLGQAAVAGAALVGGG